MPKIAAAQADFADTGIPAAAAHAAAFPEPHFVEALPFTPLDLRRYSGVISVAT